MTARGKGGGKGISQDATKIDQTGKDGGLDQNGSHAGGENQLDSRMSPISATRPHVGNTTNTILWSD